MIIIIIIIIINCAHTLQNWPQPRTPLLGLLKVAASSVWRGSERSRNLVLSCSLGTPTHWGNGKKWEKGQREGPQLTQHSPQELIHHAQHTVHHGAQLYQRRQVLQENKRGPSLAQGTAAFSINVLLCGPRDQGKAECREGWGGHAEAGQGLKLHVLGGQSG